jgi:hypothetical protein
VEQGDFAGQYKTGMSSRGSWRTAGFRLPALTNSLVRFLPSTLAATPAQKMSHNEAISEPSQGVRFLRFAGPYHNPGPTIRVLLQHEQSRFSL